MPLYEYLCKQCGHRFERIVGSYKDADGVSECPVCGGQVERLLSAPAVQFKGSGFYSTDYGVKPSRSSGSEAPPASDSGAASSAEKGPQEKGSQKSSPASSDSAAPAAKPAAKPAAGD